MQKQIYIDRNLATYVGIDAHPSEHTALAMNRFEDAKGQLRFENTKAGIAQFLHWLPTIDTRADNIVVGIEGGSGTRRELLTQLLATYPYVFEVNPLYTKQRRAFGTRSDKSDPFDAKLIAEVLTRKLAELPLITQQEFSSRMLCLKKIVWFYEEITMQGTRLKNQLHQLKREVSLSSNQKETRVLQMIIKAKTKELQAIKDRQKILTSEAAKLLEACGKNLTTFQGIGVISAAKVVAYTNGIERFETVDKFLRYAGIAPKEKSSGKAKGHRQNTMGNRNLNTALYMVALNQLTKNQKAKEYFEKKVKEGKTKKHALRCLMKRTGSIVYGLLKSGEDYRIT
jgi:transposase